SESEASAGIWLLEVLDSTITCVNSSLIVWKASSVIFPLPGLDSKADTLSSVIGSLTVDKVASVVSEAN
ncbi:hypothetical protein WICPIJ_009432, partial [Wickerhamomyces pijperi]